MSEALSGSFRGSSAGTPALQDPILFTGSLRPDRSCQKGEEWNVSRHTLETVAYNQSCHVLWEFPAPALDVLFQESCLRRNPVKPGTPRSQPGPLGVLHGQCSRLFILLQERGVEHAGRGKGKKCSLLQCGSEWTIWLDPRTHESLLRTAESGRLCALSLVCTGRFSHIKAQQALQWHLNWLDRFAVGFAVKPGRTG